jgi:hypothetical protein
MGNRYEMSETKIQSKRLKRMLMSIIKWKKENGTYATCKRTKTMIKIHRIRIFKRNLQLDFQQFHLRLIQT